MRSSADTHMAPQAALHGPARGPGRPSSAEFLHLVHKLAEHYGSLEAELQASTQRLQELDAHKSSGTQPSGTQPAELQEAAKDGELAAQPSVGQHSQTSAGSQADSEQQQQQDQSPKAKRQEEGTSGPQGVKKQHSSDTAGSGALSASASRRSIWSSERQPTFVTPEGAHFGKQYEPSPTFTVPVTNALDVVEQDDEVAKVRDMLGPVGKLITYLSSIKEPTRPGRLASIEGSTQFEIVCLMVILANTGYTFYSTNYSRSHLTEGETAAMRAFEAFFTMFYILELTLKLFVHRMYFFVNEGKWWNLFDLSLVIIGLLEMMLWVAGGRGQGVNVGFLRSFRLLKLAKSFRIVRVMRFFRELRLMLKCVVGSFVSLFWSFVMLACITALFAILFTQEITITLIDDHTTGGLQDSDWVLSADENFDSVQMAALSLFKAISGGNDWDMYYEVIRETGTFSAAVFIFYILLVWMSLTNIITSIFVEKALRFAQPDLEDQIFEKHQLDREIADQIREICETQDKDRSGTISWAEFCECLEDDRLMDCFELRGLDIKDAQMFFNVLCSISEDEEVDINTFIGGCLKMKGIASSIDLLSLTFETKVMHKIQNEYYMHSARMQSAIVDRMDTLSHDVAALRGGQLADAAEHGHTAGLQL